MIEKKSTKLNDTPFNFFSIKPFKNFLPIQRIKNGNSMIMKIIYRWLISKVKPNHALLKTISLCIQFFS